MKSKPARRRDGKTAEVASEAAIKSWITRRKNARQEGHKEGKKKRVVLGIGESLFKKFNFWRGVAGDPTLTDGIRRAMLDYIRQEKSVNPQLKLPAWLTEEEKDSGS